MPEKKASILLVEDEENLQEALKLNLELEGYEVTCMGDGASALKKVKEEYFDLILLDVMLPELDGFDVSENIRLQNIETPILMLSARSGSADRVTGLKKGADDYLTKPFGIEELVLRVRAILRRTKPEGQSKKELICGPIKIDLDRYQASFNNDIVELSATEFRLLEALIMRAGKVVTKENLLASVWGLDFKNNSTVVDTYISYLRKKFHKDGFDGIKTIRGIGFQIVGDK